ncbi:MAG: hypothetical protein HZB25_04810 [Candidatus Eisenbacteria bacterium]|nr:hypothetical protein [Candidatus Eisenbacteria bacterium]
MRFRTALTLVLTSACLLALAAGAGASTKIQKDFLARYPEAAKFKAKCLLCHTGMKVTKADPLLNAYGTDLKAAANKFEALEEKDSDKDGAANLAEIKAAANPGDARDKPGMTAKPVKPQGGAEGKTGQK